MIASVLEGAPSLAGRFRELIDPIRQERAAIRDYFASREAIYELGREPTYLRVGAVDGGFTDTPWSIGDHLCTLAVAVAGTPNGDMDIVGYRTWSDFIGHTPDTEVLATAVMMAQEVSLLPLLVNDQTAGIIDGSHVTPLIAINMALASSDKSVRRTILGLIRELDLIEAVAAYAAAPQVVGCPKSDSSTALWAECSQALDLRGDGLPDKVLSTLVLDPGEVLVGERATPSWDRLYATQGQVQDPEGKAVALELAEATAPLRQGHIQVFHAKPLDSSLAMRVEIKPNIDSFDADELLRAVVQDCAAPHLQEPVTQHMADLLAKQVASVADVQLAEARFELVETGDEDYLEYLLRHYRTSL